MGVLTIWFLISIAVNSVDNDTRIEKNIVINSAMFFNVFGGMTGNAFVASSYSLHNKEVKFNDSEINMRNLDKDQEWESQSFYLLNGDVKNSIKKTSKDKSLNLQTNNENSFGGEYDSSKVKCSSRNIVEDIRNIWLFYTNDFEFNNAGDNVREGDFTKSVLNIVSDEVSYNEYIFDISKEGGDLFTGNTDEDIDLNLIVCGINDDSDGNFIKIYVDYKNDNLILLACMMGNNFRNIEGINSVEYIVSDFNLISIDGYDLTDNSLYIEFGDLGVSEVVYTSPGFEDYVTLMSISPIDFGNVIYDTLVEFNE